MATVDNRIFVNNVPPAASQEHVAAHFAQFGSTQDVYLPMQFGTQRHKGIAYVSFEQPESKDLALRHAAHIIMGQQVTVQVCLAKGQGKSSPLPGTTANLENRLFISGIAQETTQDEVQAYFSQFGGWSDFFMPKGSYSAGHKGICFISYSSPVSAKQVMDSGPHIVAGTQVVVDMAAPRDAKGAGKGGKAGAMASPLQQQLQLQQQQQLAQLQQHPQLQQQAYGYAQHMGGCQSMLAQPMMGGYGAVAGQQMGLGMAVQQARGPTPPTGNVLPGRLFLTKMSPSISKDDLTNYFQQFGTLNDVYIPTGKLIAFVGYNDSSIATAVAQMQTHEVKPGCSVCVDVAVERPGGGKGGGKTRFSPY